MKDRPVSFMSLVCPCAFTYTVPLRPAGIATRWIATSSAA